MRYDVSELISDGVTYTEQPGLDTLTMPMRLCLLWQTDDSDSGRTEVGGLNLLSFQQRFGAVAVPSEGIGGVETHVPYRRRGYAGAVLRRAVQGARARVPVMWIGEGIEHLYEKLDFVSCLVENDLLLQVHHVERFLAPAPPSGLARELRAMVSDDLPSMVAVYNQSQRQRTWTHQRPQSWNRLLPRQTWGSGTEAWVLRDGDGLAGYVLVSGDEYGHAVPKFKVHEAIAIDLADNKLAKAEISKIVAETGAEEVNEND